MDRQGGYSFKGILTAACIIIFIWIILAFFNMYINLQIHPANERAKTARAEAEMRNIATALEIYYIDNNVYPPAIDDKGKIVPYGENGVSEGYTSLCLTTPVAHLPSLPTDPFHDEGDGYYRYATNGFNCWIMSSNGYNLKADLDLARYIACASCDLKSATFMYDYTYDPTNGIPSSGDIWRVGP